ncbi:MFS transporter [Streptomyces sp. NPDC056296]|uniref:MFS transporter n=1 Tax=Streptomyces sp. NPDC056296 TaxID=3345775 RepID=UPI0035E132ED
MNAALSAGGPVPRRGLIMTVLGCCFLMVMMDNTILNVALPAIQEDVGASNAELQWALDSYILFYAALMFSSGILADTFGRRRVLVIGLLVFAVSSALAGYSDSPQELIFWRGVMGVAGSVVPPATLAVINDIFAPEERGKAIGIWSALGGTSIAFGPIAGGFLLEHFWWGSVFLINVPIAAVCAVLLLLVLAESRSASRPRLDIIGVLLSVCGIGALVYGVIRGGETNHWTSAEVLGTLLGGLALLAVMVLFESRTATPALDVRLFRNKSFAAGTASLALSFFALTGGTFLMVFYVQGVRGHTPLELGVILLPVAVGAVVSGVLSNPMAQRFGPKIVVTAGLVLLSLSFAGQAGVGADTAMWWYEVLLGASGLGLGLVMGTATTTTMAVISPDQAAIGAGVNNTLRQVGAALGVAVLGSVLSIQYRSELGSAVNVLPADARDAASESLGGTAAAVRELRSSATLPNGSEEQLSALLPKAQDAYLSAMHISFAVGAGALVVAAAVALIWLPARIDSAEDEDRGSRTGDDTAIDPPVAPAR